MKLRQEQEIGLIYDALNISASLEVEGATIQTFYATTGTYVPNRKLVHLLLRPLVYVTDPNGLINAGDKSLELASGVWYENGSRIENNPDYGLGTDYTLKVKKNSEQPIQLLFVGEYLDPRRKLPIKFELTQLLTCISKAEEAAKPTMSLNKPSNWLHNPLKGEREYKLHASYFLDGEEIELPTAWYADGVKISEADYFYRRGQDTATIYLDSDYMYNMTLEARSGDLRATTKFIRQFPSSLQLKMLVPDLVKNTVKEVLGVAELSHADGIVENPEQYFFLKWKHKADGAGQQEKEIAYGPQALLPVQGGKNALEAEALGHYKALQDSDEAILTDSDGSILMIR